MHYSFIDPKKRSRYSITGLYGLLTDLTHLDLISGSNPPLFYCMASINHCSPQYEAYEHLLHKQKTKDKPLLTFELSLHN